jgi:hypothetical protein
MPHPPEYAQVLIESLVPATRRDNIIGDLLEEYRETQVPERGETRADWWYVRQALGFLWRAAGPWAVAFGAMLTLREVLDATVATTDSFHFRAEVSTYLAFTIYASAGVSTGWRSRRVMSGLIVSLVMTIVATAMSLAAALSVAALQSAGVMHVAASYFGFSKGLDLPILFMLIAGGGLSTIGAAIGKTGRRFPRVDLI